MWKGTTPPNVHPATTDPLGCSWGHGEDAHPLQQVMGRTHPIWDLDQCDQHHWGRREQLNQAATGRNLTLVPLPRGKVKDVLVPALPNPLTRFLTNTCRMGMLLVSTIRKRE